MGEAKEQNNQPPSGEGAGPTRSFHGSVLGPGGQIGPFRIEQELGRGGAGVVYLAHDTKLGRLVAIKSLPVELMENAKARMLFAREARVLASLNHPNIASIYEELREAEGVGYLVLEYVPGQTLAERIAGARLKLREALSIAQQIAEAVAAAHEHQVIHRDLKPRNIKITPEDNVKVLDFGLAKALGGEPADQESTITQPGRVIGTPAYMSPEQARGLETDKRSDVWSFGCILYEMLTGNAPFEGETVSETLAAILGREPDWSALPQATPANIRILLRRCLEKDPRRRVHDMADVAIEISETLSGASEAFVLPGEVAPASRLLRRDAILVALACSIAGVLIASAVFMTLVRPSLSEPPVVSRLSIPVLADKPLYTGIAPNCFLAISPDGTRLIYVAELDNRNTELYIRSIDGLEIRPIAGTMGAHNPFFSPNGQWVGFFTERQLKKVALAGGEPVTLLEDIPRGDAAFGSWAGDKTIVFSVRGGNRGLQRIPDDGGQQAETLVAPIPEDGEAYYCYPQVLPEGNAILYSHVRSHGSDTPSIEAFLPETGKRQTVLDNASYATYVRSGHLIFVQGKVLMAAPFDVRRLQCTGSAAVLVDKVGFDYGGKTPQITISRNGTLAYILRSELRKNELVWVDRQGVSEPLGAPAEVHSSPRLSPDGRLIAVTIWPQKEGTSQVYVYKVHGGAPTHLTTEGENRYPQWSPDGTRIAFWSHSTEGAGVFCRVEGASAPAQLLAGEPSPGVFLFPYSWSYNRNLHRNLLACRVQDPNTQDDIWIVDLDGDQKPKLFLGTKYKEYNPTLSPDGRWLAYVSEESSQAEIYVREYADGGYQKPVSTDGGINPAWSRDGRELYYISGNSMMVVKVTSEPTLKVGVPEPLFTLSRVIVPGSYLGRNYDVSDDGRFLMMKWSDNAQDQLICVHNWLEELKRLAPPGRRNR